jgi:hypothetical protein
MSIITVQIGQCGNQIGEKLFETIISDCYSFDSTLNNRRHLSSPSNQANELKQLNNDYLYEAKKRFFHIDDEDNDKQLKCRSVLIDMETKVVDKLLKKSNTNQIEWSFRNSNSYTQKKGSGNNW